MSDQVLFNTPKESNSELASIIAGKKYLKRYKEARFKAKNLVEGTFVDFSKILGEKQINRDKKYYFQKLGEKLRSAVQGIEEVIIAKLRECVSSYLEEELGLGLDIISQELEDNMEKLKDWISQEEQKHNQEEEQKNSKMLDQKMRNILKKEGSSFLSIFAPKGFVNMVLQIAEDLPESIRIRVNELAYKHEDCREKVKKFLSEQSSYSEFEKLKSEAIDITNSFFKLCDTFYHIINEGATNEIKKQLAEILLEGDDLETYVNEVVNIPNDLKISEEGNEAHKKENPQPNSNLNGASVSNHFSQTRGFNR